GSEGPRRRRAEAGEGRCDEGRGRRDQEEIRRGRRQSRSEVSAPLRVALTCDLGLDVGGWRLGILKFFSSPNLKPQTSNLRSSAPVFSSRSTECTAFQKTFTASASTFRKSRRPSRYRT